MRQKENNTLLIFVNAFKGIVKMNISCNQETTDLVTKRLITSLSIGLCLALSSPFVWALANLIKAFK